MNSKIILKIVLVGLFIISYNSLNAQRRHHHTNRYKPHTKYTKLPHWGHSYKVVPKRAFVFSHKGIRYRYHKGIYYKPFGAKHVIVKAPIGYRIKTLPVGHVRIILRGRTYFYYYGTYYERSDNNEFLTIEPPVGAKVDALPDGYEKVRIDNEIYYEFEGTYYKAIIDEKGEVWYELVEK